MLLVSFLFIVIYYNNEKKLKGDRQKMKIKCTLVFKYRKFTAESDDDLQNMTEVEAVADIFSAIGYTTEDIYAMEPKESEIKKHIKWKVEYGDMTVLTSEHYENDDLAWSDRIRQVVYAIIKAEYKDQQIPNTQQQPYMYQQMPIPQQQYGYHSAANPYASRVSLSIQAIPSFPTSFMDGLMLMERLLDHDAYEEYENMRFKAKKLENIFSELENLEKHRKRCDKNKKGDGK